MTLGETLRKARTARTMTIEHLASVTKISPAILRALENDDAARLPGWVFTRGFLRTYSREVGLDPDETVADFLEQRALPAGVSGDPAARVTPATRRSAPAGERIGEEREKSSDLGQMLAIAVVAVAAVAYLGLHQRPAQVAASVPSVAPRSSAPPPPAVTPVDVSVGTSGVSLLRAAGAAELTIAVEATGPCWIAVVADDGMAPVQRLFTAGERETFTVRESARMRVGDPGSLRFSINGVPGRPLGRAGQAVTIRLTPRNYREYLAR